MMQTVFRSPYTTICALIAALAGFVAFSPESFPHIVVQLAKYVMLGGFAGMGIMAKDVTSHSTAAEVAQATNDAGQVTALDLQPEQPKQKPQKSGW